MNGSPPMVGLVHTVDEDIFSLEAAFAPGRALHHLRHGGAPPEVGSWIEVRAAGADVRLLASPGSALAQIYALAAEKAFDPIHPPSVMTEAEAIFQAPHIDDPELADLTHLPFVTIDEEHSRDLDQALCILPEGEDGGWCVWYAIADASWFVRPGTALFQEALRRGATYYLPGLVIPMLPRMLSEGVVSLNPQVHRRALVFQMHLGPDGAERGAELLLGRIFSRAKLSYDGVDAWLKGKGMLPVADPEVLVSLKALETVGLLRIRDAVDRDVVRLRRVETAVQLGSERGLRFVAFTDLRNEVEQYNEQISLLCNMVGARFLRDEVPDFVQPIFRVHPPPSARRLEEMRARIDAMVQVGRPRDAERWRWRPEVQSLAAYLDSLPQEGHDGRLARAIHRQAMMINGRSSFTAVPGLHHGVGAEVYARFSAPMREIVGVYVHQQCWEKLRGAPFSPNPREDEALREAVIAASNRARALQREIDHETNRLVLDQMFAEDIRQPQPVWRVGTVVGVTRAKLHVQLDEPGIDVKIYRHHLEAQLGVPLVAEEECLLRHRTEAGTVVTRIGEPVEVSVSGQDTGSDRWILALRPLPLLAQGEGVAASSAQS